MCPYLMYHICNVYFANKHHYHLSTQIRQLRALCPRPVLRLGQRSGRMSSVRARPPPRRHELYAINLRGQRASQNRQSGLRAERAPGGVWKDARSAKRSDRFLVPPFQGKRSLQNQL